VTRTLVTVAAIVLAVSAGSVACGGGDESDVVEVELSEQQGSGQSGTATLTAVGEGRTEVVIALSNPPADPQPAHIHPGSCQELDPMPAYGLANIEDGTSVTTVPASLGELRGGKFAVNVHKSAAEIQTYAACGDID